MSLHSYSKCWLHLIWGTLNREKFLLTSEIRKKVSGYLNEYCSLKNIYIKKNYVNSEHVHALINLPTNLSIEEVLHLIKGSSSHWINENGLIKSKFFWSRGYAALSVSESNVEKTTKYIMNQAVHHKLKTYTEEYESFIKAYGLEYFKEEKK
ncbi:MAG: IS200/IS605 family transposase [Ignavibacteriales bacterium]|nr:IS200/IS605 family transposase [Ignavibacteriales bacterium]